MNPTFNNLYSLDVEADGPCPGLYSMLSFGLVPLDAPERAFYTTLAPISDRYKDSALSTNGWTREQTLVFPSAEKAMAEFARWLAAEPGEGRKVIWSDNPAFDWQFFNYYSHAFLGDNAFGHSARRISDYSAGLQGNPRETRAWRKWRTEPHTHNALEDARGNAGALRKLLTLPAGDAFAMPEAKVRSYVLGTAPHVGDETILEAMTQRDGSVLWAVRRSFGVCLNKQGHWEQEPASSNKTPAYFQRCRWASAQKAYQAWARSLTASGQGKGQT